MFPPGQKDKKSAAYKGFVTFLAALREPNVTSKTPNLRPLFGKRVIIIAEKILQL